MNNIKINKFRTLTTLIFKWRIKILFFLIGFLTSNFIYLTSLNIDNEIVYPTSNCITSKAFQQYRLAVIVPFRDRLDELLLFVPHITKFLAKQSINDFQILIMNQVDRYRFNRASLINVGALEAFSSNSTYLIIHDVDLMPLNPKLNYSHPGNSVYHISAPGIHPKYDYKTFLGGILAISSKNFMTVNGMSNRYWGWGREDDEFYLRLKEANIKIERPILKTGKNFTFLEKHDIQRRPRDKKRYAKQIEESLMREYSGLNDVQYMIKNKRSVTIDGQSCLIVDVELFCDRTDTHWCTLDYQFFD